MRLRAGDFINNVMPVGISSKEHEGKAEALTTPSITHKDAVKKWNLWCFNYPQPFERTICKIWGGTLSGFGNCYCCKDNFMTQHLIEKWQSFENRGDAQMLLFYCGLDSKFRNELVDWVMENYSG